MAENCTERGMDPSDGVIFVAGNIGLAIATALISVPAIILNSLVIASVVKTPSLQSSANLLLCGLAVSDLLTGIVPLPFYVAFRVTRVITGESNDCLADSFWKPYEISLYLIFGASQAQLCLLGFDRHKAVSNPFRYRATVTKRKTIKSTVLVWIVWFLLVIITDVLAPQAHRKYYQSFVGIFFVVVPIAPQVASYKAMRHHNRQIARINAGTTAVALAREKAMVVTLRYVTGTIFGCLLVPIAAFMATIFVKNKLYNEYVVPWAIEASFLSTCINPLIYFMRHADMKAAAYRLLGW